LLVEFFQNRFPVDTPTSARLGDGAFQTVVVYSMDLSRKRQEGQACIEKDDDVQREGALRRCLRSSIAMTATKMVASRPMRMVT
jgi:hypothetical protein